jgi:hypothetical protein
MNDGRIRRWKREGEAMLPITGVPEIMVKGMKSFRASVPS